MREKLYRRRGGQRSEEAGGEGKLRATSDFSFIGDVDFIAICVPTPLDAHQQPDIRYVRDSAEAISSI